MILPHFSNVSQQFLITFTCDTRKAFVMQNNNFISDFQVQLEVAPGPPSPLPRCPTPAAVSLKRA